MEETNLNLVVLELQVGHCTRREPLVDAFVRRGNDDGMVLGTFRIVKREPIDDGKVTIAYLAEK